MKVERVARSPEEAKIVCYFGEKPEWIEDIEDRRDLDHDMGRTLTWSDGKGQREIIFLPKYYWDSMAQKDRMRCWPFWYSRKNNAFSLIISFHDCSKELRGDLGSRIWVAEYLTDEDEPHLLTVRKERDNIAKYDRALPEVVPVRDVEAMIETLLYVQTDEFIMARTVSNDGNPLQLIHKLVPKY